MADTTFTAGTTIASSWLNDINRATYRDAINVKNAPYGAVGDGTTDDTAALVAAIAAANASRQAVIFPKGTYKVSSTLNFLSTNALRNQTFIADGQVTIYNTGSGPVATLDSGGGTLRCDSIFMTGNWVFKGNASSTYGLYTRGLARSYIRARAVDVATAGFKVDWSVLSDFDLTVSDNIDTFTVNPAIGLILDESFPGNYTACCSFNVIMEGPITNVGVDIIYAGLGNRFTGSCENIARGLRQRSTAADCCLFYMDFEGNSVYDLLIEGRGMEVIGGECSSSGSSPAVSIAATASDVSITGGFRGQIDINASATGVTINDVCVSDNPALGITGATTNWFGAGNFKVDIPRVITSRITDQLGDVGSFTATLTGCTTSPTGSISVKEVAGVVVLTVPQINATSNSTSATLTGLPSKWRPATTRVTTCVVTNNGTDVISMCDINPTTGVITLYNGVASTGFTNSGLKGIQACTITFSK